MITAGFHVPVIPFVEVVGKVGAVPLAQIVRLVPMANTGTIFGLTVTTNAVVVAHKPEVGVNIYVPEF